MSRLSWFPFYVDDFLGGTSHMTDAEVGRYVLLLCRQWQTAERGAIRVAERVAERSAQGVAGLGADAALRAVCRGSDPGEVVLEKFEVVTVDDREGIRNDRLWREWSKAKSEYEGRKKGAERTNERPAERTAERPHNPQPTTHKKQRTPKKPQRTLDDCPESLVLDDFNATTGRRLGYPGNVELIAKALEAGVTPETMHRVFVAVRDKSTPAAKWWAESHKGLDWLLRTTYRRPSDGQTMQGGLVKIPNELDEAERAERESAATLRRSKIAHGRPVDPPATPEELAAYRGDA